MKITSLRIRLLTVDSGVFYGSAASAAEHSLKWEFPLIEIGTDEGLAGYSMGRGTHGEGRALAHAIRDIYGHRLLGTDPWESERTWQRFKKENRHLYSATDVALGALDVALWDLRGKSAGLPIAALLGRYRTRVPTYATLNRQRLATPADVTAACEKTKAAGFAAAKVQFWDGPDRDIPRLREARRAMGDGFKLMFDAGGGYDLPAAVRVGQVLSELDYRWFEEPVPDSQIGLLAELRRQVRVPILAAETSRLSDMHSFLREKAVDIMRGDVYIKAGITGLRKAFAMCELFGLNLEIHAAGAPLLDLANLHVACSVRNCEFVETPPAVYRFGLVGKPLDVASDGTLTCPSGAGLGVELDWDWINAHTVLTLDCPDV